MRRQILFDKDLPAGWKVLTVDEIKSAAKHSCVAGPFGSNISSKYFVSEGTPVIRGSNLTDDLTRFVSEKFVFVSSDRAKMYAAQHVKADDLVFTCWGTVGQVGLIPKGGPFPEYIISNKQLKLRANTEVGNPLYLFYYFASPEMVAYIRARAIGAAVPGINLGILKRLPVVLPPLTIQIRIASILSAYDDLIENNTRRIAILEEMVRRVYEEWFVHFRFPGHESVRILKRELGLVPEGWEFRTVADSLTRIKPAAIYKKDSVQNEGRVIVIDQSELEYLGFHNENADFEASERSPVCMFGDHTCKLAIMTESFSIGPNTIPFVASKGIATYFVHQAVSGLIRTQEYKRHWTDFCKKRILIPPASLMEQYSNMIAPMRSLQRVLCNKTRNLRTTRDLLLPKLISGEIDVSEITAPDSMALAA